MTDRARYDGRRSEPPYPTSGDETDVAALVKYAQSLEAINGEMLAALKEIDATWPVATSELRERARKVIAEAEANGNQQDR